MVLFEKAIFKDTRAELTKGSIEYWERKIFLFLSVFTVFGIIPVLLIGSYFYIKDQGQGIAIIEISLAIVLLVTVFMKKISTQTRKTLIISLLFLFSVLLLITTGPSGGGFIGVFTMIVLSALLINKRLIIILNTFNIFVFIVVTILLYGGYFDTFSVVEYKGTWLILVLLMELCAIGIALLFIYGLYSVMEQYQESNSKRKYLTSLVQSVNDGIISIDLDARVKMINRRAQHYLGVENQDIQGKKINEICENFKYSTLELKNESLIQKLSTDGEDLEFEKAKSGKKRYLHRKISKLFDENNIHYGYIIILRDITYRKMKEFEVEYLSNHDQLTGIYNRRFYETELKRLDTKRNLPLSLVMGDVNGLKLINDSFGHLVGDELLIKVATMLKSGFRSDDIVCRLGGDEFIIILPKTTVEEAEVIMNRIIASLEKETLYGIALSLSFGVFAKEKETDNVEEVFKKTEDIMYQYKLVKSENMRTKTLKLVLTTLFEKNAREAQHSNRVGELCGKLASALGLPKESIEQMEHAGSMHDIGKIGISENILNKEGGLTNTEFNEVKKHSEIGYRILSSSNEFSEIANYVLEHHERYDGSGYPKGLVGDEIMLEAKIIGIADAYDAMTSPRTYGTIKSKEEAIKELKRCSGTQFDPEMVTVFIEEVLDKTNK